VTSKIKTVFLFDEISRQYIRILKKLFSAKPLSDRVCRLFSNFFLDSIEIINVNFPTRGASVVLPGIPLPRAEGLGLKPGTFQRGILAGRLSQPANREPFAGIFLDGECSFWFIVPMTRRSRDEIIELFRACRAKLGKAPGRISFGKQTGVKLSEVNYYWPTFSKLVEEAGEKTNEFASRLADDVVFRDYGRVCLHLGKIPTENELRIAQRELKTRTHTVRSRNGTFWAFLEKFRSWLSASDNEFKDILHFDGWTEKSGNAIETTDAKDIHQPQLRPFLPGCLQYLEVLARGETPPYESSGLSTSTLFERRVSDAFRCLGFEVKELGQGTGRKTDSIAVAQKERFALIIDAKVRTNGYTLGTEDRKFLEYAVKHGKELQSQGFDKIYLVVVAPSFRDADLKQLADYLSDSPLRGVSMITARALIRMVEESIRNRSQFSLSDFGKQVFGNKIIPN
jgi:hypothetical protein